MEGGMNAMQRYELLLSNLAHERFELIGASAYLGLQLTTNKENRSGHRLRPMPFGALFVCVGNLEHCGFVQLLAKDLETDRELFSFRFNETARYTDPTDPGDACG